MPNEPFKAERWRLILFSASGDSFLVALYCFLVAFDVFDYADSFSSSRHFYFGIGFVLLAVFLFNRAQDAYEFEEQELEYKIAIKEQHLTHKRQLVEELQIEDEAAADISLRNLKRKTAAASELTAQTIFATTQIESELRQYLTTLAAQQGISTDSLDGINARRLLNELEANTERERMQIEVDKKKSLNEAYLDVELRNMQEQVMLALIVKHFSEVQKISLLQQSIDDVLRQIDDLKRDALLAEPTRKRLIAHREDIVLTLEEHRRGRQKRLLEADNR